MTQTQRNTYTKLKDDTWGVRVSGKATVGQTVTVVKANGETKQETIRKVLWTGADQKTSQTISLCSIGQQAAKRTFPKFKSRERYGCTKEQCNCPQCRSGSECLCRCPCGFGG